MLVWYFRCFAKSALFVILSAVLPPGGSYMEPGHVFLPRINLSSRIYWSPYFHHLVIPLYVT